jgi:hypothetical protein
MNSIVLMASCVYVCVGEKNIAEPLNNAPTTQLSSPLRRFRIHCKEGLPDSCANAISLKETDRHRLSVKEKIITNAKAASLHIARTP